MPRLELRGSFLVESRTSCSTRHWISSRIGRACSSGRFFGPGQLSAEPADARGDGADLFAAGGNGDVGPGERGASSLRGTWSLVARSSELRLSSRA